ncbi:lck-interacting transmembrane adapter 1 isoform X3 [Microtus pennsylvanicus]|uniref:lck-interacting transmembrane adapter 1 isoform X3 n=1 Tax=Microtus pennsylvanicus TaxID=10058 RepID=UPI003F6C61F6
MQSLGVSGVLSQPGRKNPPAGRGLQWSCRCWSLRQPPELISPVPRSPFPVYRMRPPVPLAPLALWVLGCFSLLLWLWALCTACHRKRAQRQQTGLQGSLIPVEMSLLRQAHIRSLSKSDTRLHELRPGLRCSIAWISYIHTGWRYPGAAPGLRASLAASPVVWAGTQLTISCAKLGPGAEYACIQKRKETEQGYHELQEKAKVIPATQMDLLYSRVCKPKRRDPRPGTDQPDPQGGRGIVALGSDVEYEAITLRGRDMNQDPLENVYESIREMGP